jgi:hypothetical protein
MTRKDDNQTFGRYILGQAARTLPVQRLKQLVHRDTGITGAVYLIR